MLREVKELIGRRVDSAQALVGRCHDLLFDDRLAGIRYLVVSPASQSHRRILVPPALIQSVSGPRGEFELRIQHQQFARLPTIADDAPVSWQQPEEPAGVAAGPGELPGPGRPRRDPHLRSVREVLGYRVLALDGPAGQVTELIVDLSCWAIRFLVVSSRDLPAGQGVVLLMPLLRSIEAASHSVRLDTYREGIRNGRRYRPEEFRGKRFEEVMRSLHDRPPARAPAGPGD